MGAFSISPTQLFCDLLPQYRADQIAALEVELQTHNDAIGSYEVVSLVVQGDSATLKTKATELMDGQEFDVTSVSQSGLGRDSFCC